MSRHAWCLSLDDRDMPSVTFGQKEFAGTKMVPSFVSKVAVAEGNSSKTSWLGVKKVE